jgi:ABC-type long-subunit fatty acid transport system fused permease/ATPase subunit
MIKAFFGKRRWMPYAYGGAAVLLACMYGQIHIAVMLNTWHKRFYDLFKMCPGMRSRIFTARSSSI